MVLNARTWYWLCVSVCVMAPLALFGISDRYPFDWLSGMATLWVIAIGILGAFLGVALVLGKLHLGCPGCDTRSKVQGANRDGVYLDCPECGELLLKMGSLIGLKVTQCRPKRVASDIALTGTTHPDVDLVRLQVGSTPLGKPPSSLDFDVKHIESLKTYTVRDQGLEFGISEGVLDYAFLEIKAFQGRFLFDGEPLNIGIDSSEEQIATRFGEPYWIDRSDGEVIMFYECADGSIELQFEFPNATNLGCVTLTRNGVLSSEADRKAYGVNKPWPPTELQGNHHE